MRRKILAVDFDDTLFWTDYYSYECEPNWPVINYVRKRQKEGWIIILWTCRYREEAVAEAVAKCDTVRHTVKEIYKNVGNLL